MFYKSPKSLEIHIFYRCRRLFIQIKKYFRHVEDFVSTLTDDKTDLNKELIDHICKGETRFPNADSERRWNGAKTLKHVISKQLKAADKTI